MPFNALYLDYVQRINMDNSLREFEQMDLDSLVVTRKMIRVHGYARLEKQAQRDPNKQSQLSSEDILYGLHRLEVPLAYYISCINGCLGFYLGTWAYSLPRSKDLATVDKSLQEKISIIKGILNSSYPGCDIAHVAEKKVNDKILKTFTRAGLVRGIPSLKPLDFLDGSLQIDRLIRSLQNSNWAYLVLAQPIKEKVTNSFRLGVIGEQKALADELGSIKSANPLATYHMQMLELLLNSFTQGLLSGYWRTGVYIMGDQKSYNKLFSILSGVYTGDQSLPESINILSSPRILEAAANWILPETPEAKGPGLYQHPLKYQTLLSSMQLSSYMHLPNIEKPGFAIKTLPDFDVVPNEIPASSALHIGHVITTREHIKEIKKNDAGNDEPDDESAEEETIEEDEQAGAPYNLDIRMFNKHCFVSGTTGSGKTNTIFNLLIHSKLKGVNFLAIESAKAEYRSLRNHPLLTNMQVFTLGNENVSPFRLNPFEVQPGIPVSVHLDLLRSVFIASFGMWTPLPQVLEQCLHRVYEDRGWDLTKNKNSRLSESEYSALSFPTLTDLYNKISLVTNELGYDQKTRDDIKAALTTRINSLRTGGKGAMLDTRMSIPMDRLLNECTVLELEGVGDDDDKAFIIGLLFIRLVEYRRSQQNKNLHLLIIEEAHRLLTNVSNSNSETSGNSKGKAVESFANLLSEIRSYKQGVIISDQIPVKFAPDVIKNTTIKIAHRIVSKDDREVLGGSMALRPDQLVHYSTLQNGETLIFVEKDDAPILVKINPIKDKLDIEVTNSVIKNAMSTKFSDVAQFKSPLISDLQLDISDANAWQQADHVACERRVQKDFVRMVISVTESNAAFASLFEQLKTRFNYYSDFKNNLKNVADYTLIKLTEWFTEERGDSYGWSYADVLSLQKKIYQLLRSALQNQPCDHLMDDFRKQMYAIYARSFDPLPHCSVVCPRQNGFPPACLYRHEVQKLIAESNETNLVTNWSKLMFAEDYISASIIARGAANKIIYAASATADAKKRICGCYAQHMLKGEFINDRQDDFEKTFAEILK